MRERGLVPCRSFINSTSKFHLGDNERERDLILEEGNLNLYSTQTPTHLFTHLTRFSRLAQKVVGLDRIFGGYPFCLAFSSSSFVYIFASTWYSYFFWLSNRLLILVRLSTTSFARSLRLDPAEIATAVAPTPAPHSGAFLCCPLDPRRPQPPSPPTQARSHHGLDPAGHKGGSRPNTDSPPHRREERDLQAKGQWRLPLGFL